MMPTAKFDAFRTVNDRSTSRSRRHSLRKLKISESNVKEVQKVRVFSFLSMDADKLFFHEDHMSESGILYLSDSDQGVIMISYLGWVTVR